MSARSDGVLRRRLLISNKRGLHARASAKFVAAVAQLPMGTEVQVARDGTTAVGGSILGLMMLGAACGDEIELIVEGPEAHRAMEELSALVESRFGEE